MNIVQRIMAQGLTRYRIAKEVGASWNQVQFWEREIYKPSEKYRKRLEALLLKLRGW